MGLAEGVAPHHTHTQTHTLGYFILLDPAGHAVLSCLSPMP